MKEICADLAMEQQELDAFVADLDEDGWNTETPAEGWTIKDQIRHLAYFDDRARLAATDPEAFKAYLQKSMQDLESYLKHLENTGKDLSGAETLEWWRKESQALVAAISPMDRKTRLPWYGPDMSVMSSATARLMETWAHGQDIVDARGLTRQPTDRLRNVAHIGVRTFGWSFVNRQMRCPTHRSGLSSQRLPVIYGPGVRKQQIIWSKARPKIFVWWWFKDAIWPTPV